MVEVVVHLLRYLRWDPHQQLALMAAVVLFGLAIFRLQMELMVSAVSRAAHQ
jgi:hypothetical protein